MDFSELKHRCCASLRAFARGLDDALMPERCVFCGTRTRHCEPALCAACREDLPWLENARQAAALPLTTLVTPLAYEFPVDAALKALKFRRKLHYVPAFAALLCDAMHFVPDDVDAWLPVPLHWRRLTLRGFNQARELGKPAARKRGLPMVSGVVRRRATSSQSGLTAPQRSRNLRGAFAVRRSVVAEHVLIVDDVVTTAATTKHLAQALLSNGAGKVSVLAVARAV